MRAEDLTCSDLMGVAFSARRALERKWSGRGFSGALHCSQESYQTTLLSRSGHLENGGSPSLVRTPSALPFPLMPSPVHTILHSSRHVQNSTFSASP
jgi:hypothetical protein